MSKHVKFPSIEKFSNVIRRVQEKTRFVGLAEDGSPIFDNLKPLPVLTFQGTEKLHGTNAAIAINSAGEFWCQSRENIITPLGDNAGFATYVHSQLDLYKDVIKFADQLHACVPNVEKTLIFGEWCGGNIQSKVALQQLQKMFVVFKICNVVGVEREWYTPEEIKDVVAHGKAIGITQLYSVFDFPQFEVTVDFNNPGEAQNKIVDMTLEVEDCSYTAKQLGADMEKCPIGEGIVFSCIDPGYENSGFWFKSKGLKHQKGSAGKPLKEVDLGELAQKNAVVEQICPEWRLEQMLQETFNTLNGGIIEHKKIGEFIKAVFADIVKEELDTVAASGFTLKELNGLIADKAKKYLFEVENTFKVR